MWQRSSASLGQESRYTGAADDDPSGGSVWLRVGAAANHAADRDQRREVVSTDACGQLGQDFGERFQGVSCRHAETAGVVLDQLEDYCAVILGSG
jgi:hypothetical protein